MKKETVLSLFRTVAKIVFSEEKIIKHYKKDFNIKNMDENFYFDTPGNLLKCRYLLEQIDSNTSNNLLRSPSTNRSLTIVGESSK